MGGHGCRVEDERRERQFPQNNDRLRTSHTCWQRKRALGALHQQVVRLRLSTHLCHYLPRPWASNTYLLYFIRKVLRIFKICLVQQQARQEANSKLSWTTPQVSFRLFSHDGGWQNADRTVLASLPWSCLDLNYILSAYGYSWTPSYAEHIMHSYGHRTDIQDPGRCSSGLLSWSGVWWLLVWRISQGLRINLAYHRTLVRTTRVSWRCW